MGNNERSALVAINSAKAQGYTDREIQAAVEYADFWAVSPLEHGSEYWKLLLDGKLRVNREE